MSAERLEKLRAWLAEEKLDAFVVSRAANLRYLTGFTGEGVAVVDESVLICTDSRFIVQAKEEAPEVESVAGADGHLGQAAERLASSEASRAGFEADHLTYAGFETLEEKAPEVEFIPSKQVLARQRAVKDPREVELVEAAAAIADRAFEAVRPNIEPGVTEREVALDLERQMLLGGAEGVSFPTIVAGGPNGAKPHATPGERARAEGDLVVVDFGARARGYCSDCTRTVMLGEPDERQAEVYDAVREAQRAALKAVAPGVPTREVDATARDLLAERGFAKEFSHGVGHGVGLEVHELPTLSAKSEDILEAGMIVTVEPGVYIEGWGGVRLEELVLVTEDGGRTLTQAPYDL
jgi:Xaa-Pro aminopeptidase/Xaa-Pro dipeptidase